MLVLVLEHMGGANAFPILTLDAKGRVAANSQDPAVGAAMTVTGDSGSEDINLLK